jgi:hypothetical protein
MLWHIRNMRKARLTLGDRFRTLFGSYGAGVRVAAATGLTPDHVSRVFNGRAVEPEYLSAIVELLEALPPKDWPERWRR